MFLGSDRPHPGSGTGLIPKAGEGVYHFVWSSSKPELLARGHVRAREGYRLSFGRMVGRGSE